MPSLSAHDKKAWVGSDFVGAGVFAAFAGTEAAEGAKPRPAVPGEGLTDADAARRTSETAIILHSRDLAL